MSYRLGLTGSIGMGKSTTAAILLQYGVPVWDADGAVHRLYNAGGAAVAPIAALCPEALVNGGLDRSNLRTEITTNPDFLQKIQDIVHPIVAADRADFIARTQAEIIALDIPLLFETGGERNVAAVIVVSAPEEVQRQRVMARPEMTAEKLEAILARQLPDAEKRRRADIVIDTSKGLDSAQDQVRAAIVKLMAPKPS
jgi:dephospho-CoA kinase